ncbi:MAG: lamin tail domain-containing protein [Bacteroidaceae bacterium]
MNRFLLLFLSLFSLVGYAQLNEPFDEPTFYNNYPWQGDLTSFTINSNQELQLNTNNRHNESSLYLYTGCFSENEWRFRLRSDYKGTTSNYFKIFLFALTPNTEDPEEAIFVRLGYSKKNITLCEQVGNMKADVLINGRTLTEEAHTVDVKVTLDKTGFKLYSLLPGEKEYTLEGQSVERLSKGSGYFMIDFLYSSLHSRDKYIDNLYIQKYTPQENPLDSTTQENTDSINTPTSPRLLSLDEIDAYSLLASFDCAVDASKSTFSLDDLGNEKELFISSDHKMLKLVWEQPRQKKEYTLTYTNLYDMEGHLTEGSQTFESTYEVTLPKDVSEAQTDGEIILNEIMANPKGLTALPETEYIEIKNNDSHDISLNQWTLLYDEREITLPSVILKAGAYAILYKKGRTIKASKDALDLAIDNFPAALNNTGKRLRLKSPSGQIIDDYTYEKAKAALSWERTEQGWQLCSDNRGGTPGEKNSINTSTPPSTDPTTDPTLPDQSYTTIVKGDLIINELLPDPVREGSEYIELYNRSDQILSLKDLILSTRKADGSLSTTYPLSSIQTTLSPKSYILLSKDLSAVKPYYDIKYPEQLCEIKIPILRNDGATLVLLTATDKRIIDEVTYSSKWQDFSLDSTKGVALERVSPDKESNDPTNWCSAMSVVNYTGAGTPGYQNSQYKDETSIPTSIEKPLYSDAEQCYWIHYSFNEPGYHCHIRIFDLSGRIVAEPTSGELFGTEGKFRWDGTNGKGSSLPTGLYIFHAQLFNPNGKTKVLKKTFLVR